MAQFTVLEKFTDIFIGWPPMYGLMKLVLFVYLWYPKTKLNQGCTSSLEVNPYLSQVEELKQKLIAAEEKLASPEDRICVYDEQIQELKKMLAKKEAHCRGYAIGVEELQKKIAKQYMKTTIPRKRGKVLRNIVVFFWGLLCVVIVAFAIK
ncbi:putative HVA22-like protein g [Glycine max]|uniref:putative HVA22-like protein g n=1 Tax=Glycine max TaxID=3847 RepID=UPI001B3579D1|nr:putative HVA22-like protein g [Glycine max]